jgi:hypothetical protein
MSSGIFWISGWFFIFLKVIGCVNKVFWMLSRYFGFKIGLFVKKFETLFLRQPQWLDSRDSQMTHHFFKMIEANNMSSASLNVFFLNKSLHTCV